MSSNTNRKESKGKLKDRLLRENRWEAFIQVREKFVREGSERTDAWELAAEQFPPLTGNVPIPKPEDAALAHVVSERSARKGQWVPTGLEQSRQAVVWVADCLDNSDVRQADAPCPAAWTLLRWVRRSPENEDEFWKRIYSRLLPVPEEAVRKPQAAEPAAVPASPA